MQSTAKEYLVAEPCPECGADLQVRVYENRGGLLAQVVGDLCGCYPDHHDDRVRLVERAVIAAIRAAEGGG